MKTYLEDDIQRNFENNQNGVDDPPSGCCFTIGWVLLLPDKADTLRLIEKPWLTLLSQEETGVGLQGITKERCKPCLVA